MFGIIILFSILYGIQDFCELSPHASLPEIGSRELSFLLHVQTAIPSDWPGLYQQEWFSHPISSRTSLPIVFVPLWSGLGVGEAQRRHQPTTIGTNLGRGEVREGGGWARASSPSLPLLGGLHAGSQQPTQRRLATIRHAIPSSGEGEERAPLRLTGKSLLPLG